MEQEYQDSITVNASPDQVFQYCSDFKNMPDYLPTLQKARSQGSERIEVEGNVRGHRYTSDGKFNADPNQRKMEWSSDGERNYHGWLQVNPDSGDSSSRVEVHLFFDQHNDVKEKIAEQQREPDQEILQGIQSALQSIKNQIEGSGGKVDSANSDSYGRGA